MMSLHSVVIAEPVRTAIGTLGGTFIPFVGMSASRRKVSLSIFVWAIPDFDEARMIHLVC